MTAKEKLTKARTGLVISSVFFGTLALRLKLVEADDGDTTLCTDGHEVRFNPEWVDSLQTGEIRGALAHEILHIALGHLWRGDGRCLDTWNEACDYTVNEALIEAGFTLPQGALLNRAFNGKSTEEIYSILYVDKLKQQQQKKENEKGGSQGTAGKPWGGFTTGGQQSTAEQKTVQEEWKVAVAQAAAMAKAAGDKSLDYARTVKDAITPNVDVLSLLIRFMDRSRQDDYRWFPPNSRYLSMGIYAPSLSSEGVGTIVVVLDTSGSMKQHDIDTACALIKDACVQVNPEVLHVVYADSAVKGSQSFNNGDIDIELIPVGGGGTRFSPTFDWIEAEGLNPCCVLYLTDLKYNDRELKAPGFPVLWLSNNRSPRRAPDFGEVVYIN